jgi:porphobilinogen synthase
MLQRPRRNRASVAVRSMVRETTFPHHPIVPPFVQAGPNLETPVSSMRGQARRSLDRRDSSKGARGRWAQYLDGPLQRVVHELEKTVPKPCLDVALDPCSPDGHDGVLIDGRIDNDQTLPLLAAMATARVRASADRGAPSDTRHGRVAAIRSSRDEAGFTGVGILSGCVKYAPAFYGPFREALDSAHAAASRKRTRWILPTCARPSGTWRSTRSRVPTC